MILTCNNGHCQCRILLETAGTLLYFSHLIKTISLLAKHQDLVVSWMSSSDLLEVMDPFLESVPLDWTRLERFWFKIDCALLDVDGRRYGY